MGFSPAAGSDMDEVPEAGPSPVGSSPEAAVHVDGQDDEPPLPPPADEAQELVLPEGVTRDDFYGPMEMDEGEESPHKAVSTPAEARSYHRMANSGAYRLVLAYSRQVERRPRCIMLLMTVVVIALIAAMFKIPSVQFDFSTFIRADGDAMLRREAYLLALGERKGPNARRRLLEDGSLDLEELIEVLPENGANASSSAPERRLYAQLIYTQSMSVLYESEVSIFDKKVMQSIRDFEVRLRSLAGWQAMCSGMVAPDLAYLCDPGESVVAYAWASQEPAKASDGAGARLVMVMDGQSTEPVPPPAFLAYIERGGHQVLDFSRFFPTTYTPPLRNGTGAEADGPLPQQLRSRFWFSFDVTGTSQSEIQGNVQSAKEAWGNFVRNELYSVLQEGAEGAAVKVRYAGDQLTSFELIQTLQNDLLFAIGSVLVVLLCLWFQLQAIWMSLASLFVILTALPIAYVLTPAEKLTITSFLALFLVVGIGSDTVFVFGDFWEQERHRKLDDRVAVVLVEAGKNCFATSLTTAASFLANLASVLQPLREFGFFMGLCVLWVFVLIAVYLPPMLVLQARSRQAKEDAKAARREVHPGSMSAIVPAGEAAPQAATQTLPETGCPRLVRSYLRALATRVAFCPGVVSALTVLLVALFTVGISLDIRLATGVPQIFPTGHNQVEVPLLEAKFSAIPRVGVEVSAPQQREVVCNVDAVLDGREGCSLFWCDQSSGFGYSGSSSTDGNCWASPLRLNSGGTPDSMTNCSTISFQARVASPTRPSTTQARAVLESMSQSLTSSRASSVSTAVNTGELRTLVAESWGTGNVVTSRFFNLGTATIRLPSQDGGTEACAASGLCFWDVPACDAEGWTSLGNHSPSRRLEALEDPEEDPLPLAPLGRQLQIVQTVPTNKQIDISIVWGIRAPRRTPLLGPNAEQWSFDPTFEMQNPWAQRAVHSMCEDELPPELRVLSRRCWIQDFRTRLLSMSRRFPSRDFTSEVVYFSNGNLPMQEQLWMLDGSVAAAMLYFKVDVAFDIGASAISEYKALWDAFVDERNLVASDTANRAWHTAQAWVMAEAELAIINSTIVTIVVAAVCGWACMLLFTNDPTLALLVLLLVLGVVTGLAFFMIVVMAWALGPIEVISLVVFVGYSVTYSLHVAHIFGEVDGSDPEAAQNSKAEGEGVLAPEAGDVPPALAALGDQGGASPPEEPELDGQAVRAVRVRKALMRIGLSTLSSTLSTVGASAFLLSATMQVFTKLGSVVIAVSLLSCIASLVVLPAVLVLFGPGLTPWYQRCCSCCCRKRMQRGAQTQESLDDGGRGNGQLPMAVGRSLR